MRTITGAILILAGATSYAGSLIAMASAQSPAALGPLAPAGTLGGIAVGLLGLLVLLWGLLTEGSSTGSAQAVPLPPAVKVALVVGFFVVLLVVLGLLLMAMTSR
jgi:hypothetical protein